MSAKLAVVGAVTAGMFAVGGVAFAVAFQPVPVHEVQMIQPAADVSTPTAAPTTAAPAPVESTQAPVVVATSAPEVIVPQVVQPAPTQGPQLAGHYADGSPVKTDSNGNVVMLGHSVEQGTAPNSDGYGNPIPTPTP